MINSLKTPSYKIDAHQHFWNYDPEQYAWIADEMEILKRDFLPRDWIRDCRDTGYRSSISIQARQTVAETDWLLGLAKENPGVIGIVGWLDLCAPDIGDQAGEYSRNTILKGLRHVLQDEADENYMLRPEFLNGISCLQPTGLVYEILIFPRQLPNAIKLAEMFPDQNFVLDHCAKPDIRRGEISEWAGLINSLASFPNVSCKVSGLVTEADWSSWTPDDFYPYLDVIWDAFGEDRIMLGSDWPVCLLAASFPQVVCLIEGYFEQHGVEVVGKLTSGNAIRIYSL